MTAHRINARDGMCVPELDNSSANFVGKMKYITARIIKSGIQEIPTVFKPIVTPSVSLSLDLKVLLYK